MCADVDTLSPGIRVPPRSSLAGAPTALPSLLARGPPVSLCGGGAGRRVHGRLPAAGSGWRPREPAAHAGPGQGSWGARETPRAGPREGRGQLCPRQFSGRRVAHTEAAEWWGSGATAPRQGAARPQCLFVTWGKAAPRRCRQLARLQPPGQSLPAVGTQEQMKECVNGSRENSSCSQI